VDTLGVEKAVGDVTDPDSIAKAMDGVTAHNSKACE
jgi:uncharacterized protein YbjT (DUF2867 family)